MMTILVLFAGICIGFLFCIAFIFLFPKFAQPIFDRFFNQLKTDLEKRQNEINDTFIADKGKRIKIEEDKAKGEINTAMQLLVTSQGKKISEELIKVKESLDSAKTKWEEGGNTTGESLDKLTQSFVKWHTNLTNPVNQGQVSEISLVALLEDLGFVKDRTFREQTSFKNDDDDKLRPDIFVKTKGQREFVIDSKAPMTYFVTFVEPTEDITKEQSLSKLCKAFESHIKKLGDKKYHDLDNKTAPFTVMYVPNTALYLTVMNEKGDDMLRLCRKHNVVISPPSMIIPVLQMFREGLLEENFHANKNNFRTLVSDLIEAIGSLENHFIRAEKSLSSAQKSMESFRGSWNRFLPVRSKRLIENQDLEVEAIKKIDVVSDDSEDNREE